MAFVLKPATERSRGVVIFNCKEQRFLEVARAGLSSKLKNKYLVGLHWGGYRTAVVPDPFYDFHLAGPGTVTWAQDARPTHIPLCSRNFCAPFFGEMSVPKLWDIMIVAHPLKYKNLDQFLRVVRRLFDEGKRYRVLIVAPVPDPIPQNGHWYVDILSDYERMFTPEDFKWIDLWMIRRSSQDLYPVTQRSIAHLLSSSRVLSLFTDEEGESRIIAEALCSGLTVVVKKHLRGGGRDYLDQTNSVQFEHLERAHEAFIEALENSCRYQFDSSKFIRELREDYSSIRLVEEIGKLFSARGEVMEGPMDLEGLDRKLPGHARTLPPSIASKDQHVGDLVSVEQAWRYLEHICDNEPSAAEIAVWNRRSRKFDRAVWLKSNFDRLKRITPAKVASRVLRFTMR